MHAKLEKYAKFQQSMADWLASCEADCGKNTWVTFCSQVLEF